IVGGKRELTAAVPAGAERPRRDRPSGATRPRRSGASGTTATSTEAGRAASEEAPVTEDVATSAAPEAVVASEATESTES
ncbi:MAG: small subunit ribosomal protein, partial [Mycobacterium sp.]|nr:small subunit ribosomal protein [Mycobacterium sp.]